MEYDENDEGEQPNGLLGGDEDTPMQGMTKKSKKLKRFEGLDEEDDEEGEGEELAAADGVVADSSEEEESDDEQRRQVAEGFIVEDDDEDEDGEGDEEDEDEMRKKKKRKHKKEKKDKKRKKKRKRRDDDEDDEANGDKDADMGNLDDDDLDLMDENAGIRRSKPAKRLRRAGHGVLDPEDLDLDIGAPIASTDPKANRSQLEHLFDDVEGFNEGYGDGGIGSGKKKEAAGGFGGYDEMEDFIEEDEEDEDEEGGGGYGRREREMEEEDEQEVAAEMRRRPKKKGKEKQRRRSGGAAMGGMMREMGEIDQDTMNEILEVFGDGQDFAWALEDDEPDERERKKELRDIFEPSEIQERMMTEEDEIIRNLDVPERLQLAASSLSDTLRTQIVTQPSEDLFAQGLISPGVSYAAATTWVAERISLRTKEDFLMKDRDGNYPILRGEFLNAVRKVLEFINRDFLEVPFIWTHRLDYIKTTSVDPAIGKGGDKSQRGGPGALGVPGGNSGPGGGPVSGSNSTGLGSGKEGLFLLQRDDLWKIQSLSLRFRALQERKRKLEKQFSRLHLPSQDPYFVEVLESSESIEEISDLSDWVSMKYSRELEELWKDDRRRVELSEVLGGENMEEGEEERRAIKESAMRLRRPIREGRYERVKQTAVKDLAEKMAISAQDLATNFFFPGRGRPDIDDIVDDPESYGNRYAQPEEEEGGEYPDANAALTAAMLIASTEIGKDPFLRKKMREIFKEHGQVSVRPTDKGLPKIDDMHVYYPFKYLHNKPAKNMLSTSQFLMILQAEREGLVTIDIHLQDTAFKNLRKSLQEIYLSDYSSSAAQAWDEIRKNILNDALQDHLLPMGAIWTRNWLRDEEEDWVGGRCQLALQNRIDQAPFYNRDTMTLGEVPHVIAISHGMGDMKRDPVYAVYVDNENRYRSHIILENLRDQRNRERLQVFIMGHKPAVSCIAVGGFGPNTMRLKGDIETTANHAATSLLRMDEFEETRNEDARNARATTDVIWVPDDVARIYQNSKRAEDEFPGFNTIFKYCVALARYVQGPVNEYAALKKDLTAINYDLGQKWLTKERLMGHLEQAMVNTVNMIGVDVNRAVHDPYYGNLLPYISGLGPRKAQALVNRINSRIGGSLTCRSQLIMHEVLTRNVFMNCAAFLRISLDFQDSILEHPRTKDDEDDNAQADALDATRIHNEDYEIARKMAADAMEVDEEDLREAAPSKYAKDLMLAPDRRRRLEELSLDDFADQLQQMMSVPKRTTLYMIREEIQKPYGEKRAEFKQPSVREVFTMLTGETRDTLELGLIVPAVVTRFRVDRGISVRLDSGIEGVVLANYLSDIPVVPQNLFQLGQTIQAMVIDIHHSDLSVELSTQPSAVDNGDHDTRRQMPDQYFDHPQAEIDKTSMDAKKKKGSSRTRRVVQHPNFHNFNAGQAEQHLAGQQRGDCVIRPSSRGVDHLALTWKVDTDTYQHIDILELDKPNEVSIGRTLRVGKYSYSDLDELIFSHVKAMARKVEEMMGHDKYKGGETELNNFLTNYVMANPEKSIYAFGIDRRNPGQFLCSFRANKSTPSSSWSVKIIPGAYVLQDNFSDPLPDMTMLCNAFKTRYAVLGQTRANPAAAAATTPYHQTPSHRTPNPYPAAAAAAAASRTPAYHPPNRTPNHYPAGGRTPSYGPPAASATPIPQTVYAAPPPQMHGQTPVWPGPAGGAATPYHGAATPYAPPTVQGWQASGHAPPQQLGGYGYR